MLLYNDYQLLHGKIKNDTGFPVLCSYQGKFNFFIDNPRIVYTNLAGVSHNLKFMITIFLFICSLESESKYFVI